MVWAGCARAADRGALLDRIAQPQSPSVPLTASQIVRPQAPDSKRDRREAWFRWRGAALPPLDELVTYYPRRFSQEHGYRFDKQNLLWDAPKLQTPEQMQRWTDVVRNELVLARDWVVAEQRPWERRRLITTPRQVRRAMDHFIGQLGTPAPPPQLRRKAPGQAHGAHVKRAERQAVCARRRRPRKSVENAAPGPRQSHRRGNVTTQSVRITTITTSGRAVRTVAGA